MASLSEEEKLRESEGKSIEDLDGLSIEELSAVEEGLDKQIEENANVIEEQRKALIERITGKRAKITEQQVRLSELRQERDNQPSKDSQQH